MASNDNGFTVKKMREVAKQLGLQGYYKLKKTELIEALGSNVNDEPVLLAIPVPTPSLPASLSKLKNIYDKTKSAVSTVYDKTKSVISTAYDKTKSTAHTFAEWIISYVPEVPKRIVDEKIAAFKSTINYL